MSVPILPGVLTVSQAAKAANIGETTLRREIKEGRIRTRRIAGCVRILDTELARWLNDYESNAP
jgi:excisionase family DNA binding protein